jgi:hypothetical protein
MVIMSSLLVSCGNFVDYVPDRCEPKTCQELGKDCRTWPDGCGDEVNCGGCQLDEICHAEGLCVTECNAATCLEMGMDCGSWDDGCGDTIDCGGCDIGMICGINGRCVTDTTNQEDSVSECGGFESNGGSIFADPPEYCVAEVLHWMYEADTQLLKLADARVLLNCCGDHSMTMEVQAGVYVFTEWDAPEGGWGRCGCMCVFDYTIQVTGIPQEVINVRINRDVSDWPEETGMVWEGQLNLTEGSGFVVIDETDVGPWCGEF